MTGIEFSDPRYLYLLLLLPIWLLLLVPWPDRAVLFARGESARAYARGSGAGAAAVLLIPRLLRAFAIGCLIVAVAGPQRVEIVEEPALVGSAMAVVVDLSSSMLAEDMDGGRSRIDVAREAASRFAMGRTKDEVALVAFAGDALTRVPLTTDPSVVASAIEGLEIQLVGDGTDISEALLTSLARLQQSERESRVVVLLTDGAHNGTGVPPLAAARAAAALGVRVHAISVLPPEDPAAAAARRALYAALDPRAEMQTVLGGIARITGGRYFHAATSTALDSIYREIDELEPPSELISEHRERHPLRLGFILSALMLLGSEAALRGSRWGIIP